MLAFEHKLQSLNYAFTNKVVLLKINDFLCHILSMYTRTAGFFILFSEAFPKPAPVRQNMTSEWSSCFADGSMFVTLGTLDIRTEVEANPQTSATVPCEKVLMLPRQRVQRPKYRGIRQ